MRRGVALLLAIGWLSCSDPADRYPTGPEDQPTPRPTPASDTLQLLQKSAEVADVSVQLARRLIVIPFPGGSVTVGYRNGFYVVKVVMFGSERTLMLQFQDASGDPMQGYDPDRTRAIRLVTTNEDRAGLRHFDVLVRGVQQGADEFRIDGNGRYQQRDTVWFFYFNHLALAKVGNPYPVRGELVLETEHASGSRTSIRFRFNGSRVVDGVLESGSVSIYFTLDLVSLVVTPVEPTP